MKTLGDELAAALHHEHLKPRGFKKARHTFVRDGGEYAEHYQVQGSAWNDSREPWICYLNCGISFRGLLRRTPDADCPRTHAFSRAGLFVPTARAQYEVTRVELSSMASELADVTRSVRTTSSVATWCFVKPTRTGSTPMASWPIQSVRPTHEKSAA